MNAPDFEEERRPTAEAKALLKMTGGPDHASFPSAITAPGGGGKFASDGRVLPFPGNTFLCHIDQQSQFYAALCAVQDALRKLPQADHFTFLPKPSFHMTIFCGVSGSPLGSDGWPKGFAQGATLDQITDAFKERLKQSGLKSGVSVLPDHLYLPTSVSMRAATDEDEAKLRATRQALEDLTGLCRGDVTSYVFHVSMAYVVKWLSQSAALDLMQDCKSLFGKHLADCDPIHFSQVEFCTFENMHRFEKVRLF
jgi:hypothetical protein